MISLCCHGHGFFCVQKFCLVGFFLVGCRLNVFLIDDQLFLSGVGLFIKLGSCSD